jgi:alkanesulfonate monooxygenase SsuD/methylene tetrahydromethanopterin reductase-like flavin-dependent oxidoreductase (luciferase family)
MKLGLYADMRNRPGSGNTAAQHYGRWLERFQDADRRGCASIWLTEHHFFDDDYLPQIWTLAAAIAAKTERVRIGSAVALLTLHNVLDTAEQVALVDVLSNGRAEPGFGVGYRKLEYQAYEGDFKHRYGVFRQRIPQLRALWGEEPADGVRTITPAPVQRPMPLWGGFGGPQGARLAGELGLGLQSLDPTLLAPYREGLAASGRDPAQAQMSGHMDIFVTDDPERAWAELAPHVAYRWDSYNRHAVQGTRREHEPVEPIDVEARRGGFLLGTADQIIAAIRERTAGLPVTEIYAWADYPGLPEDTVERHLELLMTEVAPRLAKL